MKFKKKILILTLFMFFFCMSETLAYYAKDAENNVTISTASYHNLSVETNRSAYGISNGNAIIELSLTNDNLYDLTYTISFNSDDMNYEIDGSTNLTYTIGAGTSKTHSIQISETDLTSLGISVNVTLPYNSVYTKTVTLDHTSPACAFGSWSSESILTDENATIVLTCSDSAGIADTSLSSDDLSLSNGNILNISSITTGGTANERTFTISVLGLGENGTGTISLKEDAILDNNNNGNELVTSDSIEVIADKEAPIIVFSPSGNEAAAKTQSTVVEVIDMSEIVAMKYLWTQTEGTSAENGTDFTSGNTITKDSGDGTWYLCIYALDEHGYSANECSGAFVLDNTAPTLSVPSPIYLETGSTDLLSSLVSASDSGSGIDTIVATINNTQYEDASTLASANYEIVYTVTDLAGNSTTQTSVLTIYVDLVNTCAEVTTTTSEGGLYKDPWDTTRCIYRGAQSGVNNYVRFSDEESATWQLISVEADGTFKTIKQNTAGTRYWHSSSTSSTTAVTFYSTDPVNSFKTYLNGTYYNSLGEVKQSFISAHKFYVGNIVQYDSTVSADAVPLSTEISSEKKKSVTITVGLPNASDYHKASSHCKTSTYIYNCAGTTANNWLHPSSSVPAYYLINCKSQRSFVVSDGLSRYGGILARAQYSSSNYRPVFFINAETKFVGTGTIDDPYVPIAPSRSNLTCIITTTTGYETSKELTIAASDASSLHATEAYSFDNTTWGPTNTKTISAAGTYFGYIQDVDNRTNKCSIKIVSRKEYRKRTCTATYSSWTLSTTEYSETQYTGDECRSKTTAEDGGYLVYYSCKGLTGQDCSVLGLDQCFKRDVYKRSCSSSNCGAWGAWTTTSASSGCKTQVQTRTTYAPDSSAVSYNKLNLVTDAIEYGGCDSTQTMSLSITNSNSYAVTYSLAFDNADLTYTVDGSALSTYTLEANSTVTHSVVMSGITSATSLVISADVTSPFSMSQTKTVNLNYSCMQCTFGDWTSSSIETDETATITLSCTDNLALATETLTSSAFTLSNADILNIESITTSGTEMAKDYIITVRGGTEAGSSTITISEGRIANLIGNTNEEITSSESIEVIPKKYMVTYNANKFFTLPSQTLAGVTVTYDPDTSELTLNGTPTGTLSFLTAAEEMILNTKYNLSLEYVSGSYTSNTTMTFGVDVVTSVNGGHTSTRLKTSMELPTSGINSNELTIDQIGVDEGYGFHTWLWMSSPSDVTFVNYKVKVNMTKVDQIEVTYKKTYETLGETPSRLGYTFAGWYTEETGGTEVTTDTQVTATSDHTLYAHWTEKPIYTYYNVNGGTITEETDGGTFTTDDDGFVFLNGELGTSTTYPSTTTDLWNWNNSAYMNITKDGYSARTGEQWNTASDGSGRSYSHSVVYDFLDLISNATDMGTYYRLNLYVNWAESLAPIITFGTNENMTPSKSQSTTVTVEDDSGATSAKYLWTQTDGTIASDGATFTSGETITKNNGNGIWYLCIYAVDSVGNSANECSGQFVLDNTAPTISSLDPLYVEIGSTTPLLDLISIADAYDSEPTVTTTINGTSYTEVSALTSTSYPLVVTATDDAGNVATKNIELIIYFFLQDKCDTVTTSSDYTGLFKDQTNSARCIYRGGSASTVNNYLRFSDDDAWDWRIIGVESTGTIKIIKETSIGNNYWNNGSETLPNLSSAGIKTILQTYYDGLSDSKKEIITQHTFYTGNIYVSFDNAYSTVYLAGSSSNAEVNKEKSASTTLYAGLINASDFHKAYRTSSGSGCTASSFIKSCAGNATSNWLWSTAYTYYWTASVYSTARGVVITNASDRQAWGGTAYRGGTHLVPTKPVVFLRSETAFYGSGTQEDPYVPILPTVSSSTCTVTTTDGYETSKTLTINASDTSSIHATEGYSFDNTTWGPTNTKTISAAGTYFGYIKDTNNRTNSCSIRIVARTEYRKRTCTPEYGSWVFTTQEVVGLEGCSGLRSKESAEAGGYLQYQVCHTYAGGSSGCISAIGESICYVLSTYKRSCSSTNCGDWGAWGTTSYESGCKTKVQSRTTYAPSS